MNRKDLLTEDTVPWHEGLEPVHCEERLALEQEKLTILDHVARLRRGIRRISKG
jgi:hypothetical protein